VQFEPQEKPLRRPAAFRTSDIEEFTNVALTRFGATSVEVSDPDTFEAHGRSAALLDVVVLSAASTSLLTVDYPEFDFARLSIPRAGGGTTTIGNETVEINQHQSCVTSPGTSTKVRCEKGHDWLNLRVSSTALRRKLASLLGVSPNVNPRFLPRLDLDHRRARSLCQLAGFFAQQLDPAAGELPSVMALELEQVIVTNFLFATRHTFSDLLERDPQASAPWQVRRAEEYIEAHWDQPVNIEALVDITGSSARSIFRTFRQSRGYSPMAFAKMVRLRRARELLAAADETTTVTGIALKCGFENVGHFARHYREAFGHLPSESLARSRLTRT
jgi:AraC-like DNA-binding protein